MDYTPITFEEIWEKDFAPHVASQRQRDNDARTEAMSDATLTLCGEPVRQMTPADMLQLDTLENPFIAGSADGALHFIDCAAVVWEVHRQNDHSPSLANLWRRGRVVSRLAGRSVPAMAEEITAYIDRMLLDPGKPKPTERLPDQPSAINEEPKTHFLAPLIVNVATDIGHIDPMSGELLAHTPLPRLLQYQRAALQQKGEGKTYTEIDSLRNRCVDRMNQINWARRSGLPDPTFPPLP